MLFRKMRHASVCFSRRLSAQSSLLSTVACSSGNLSVACLYLLVKLGGSSVLSSGSCGRSGGFLYGLWSMLSCWVGVMYGVVVEVLSFHVSVFECALWCLELLLLLIMLLSLVQMLLFLSLVGVAVKVLNAGDGSPVAVTVGIYVPWPLRPALPVVGEGVFCFSGVCPE